MGLYRNTGIAGFALLMASSLPTFAHAQSVEEFYRGKTITMMISAAAGGSSDQFARDLAPYLTKYLPGNPEIVTVNVPGAGGMVAAAQLQHNQPQDGTVIALLQRNNFYIPLVSNEANNFDAREVNWLGSVNKEHYAISAWDSSPVQSADEIFTTEMIIGSTSFTSETRTLPAMMNEVLGAKFNVIAGYTGSEDVSLALERGEVQGKASTVNNLNTGNDPQLREQGKLKVLMQLGLNPSKELEDVPSILDYVKDDAAAAVVNFMLSPLEAGRPLAAPPNVPDDRLQALRDAFNSAVADPEFKERMTVQNSSVDPISGEEIEEIIASLYDNPPEVLDVIRGLLKE